MHNLTPILIGAAITIASLSIYRLGKKLYQRHKKKQRNEFIRGYLKGLHTGALNHASWITRVDGIPANGFAEPCRACGNIQETILNADVEYWTCGECGHRQGAPLATISQGASP